MVIDAHVHLPVGKGMDSLASQRRRLLEELARCGADGCIVIADSEPESVIGTNEEYIDLLAEDENVHVIAGISPLIDYEARLAQCEAWLRGRRVIGLKLFTGHEDFYLTDPRLERVYALALRYDVPVLFHSGWDNAQYGAPEQAAEVARRHPALKLVCCHCWYPHIEQAAALAGIGNLYFDLSSVADDPALLPKIAPAVRDLIAAAPGRVMFGSDYSGCSMAAHLEWIRDLGLDEDIEERVLAGSARALYRI